MHHTTPLYKGMDSPRNYYYWFGESGGCCRRRDDGGVAWRDLTTIIENLQNGKNIAKILNATTTKLNPLPPPLTPPHPTPPRPFRILVPNTKNEMKRNETKRNEKKKKSLKANFQNWCKILFFKGWMGWDGMGDENPTKWKCWERNIESINFPKQINKQINNFTHIHITLEKMKKKNFLFLFFFRYLFFFPI